MTGQPQFSLIVPTRRRTGQLRRLLDSLAATTARPSGIEVVIVVDADDPESIQFQHDGLQLRRVVVAPGLSMGALNMAGYEACSGHYVMLLNDDVIARTPGWDETISHALTGFPDELVLIHTNDMMFGEILCTFPMVSRHFCELAGGICPRDYQRYRIDDHIGDTFNLLALLGERRIVYLPEVIFEHFHYEEPESGAREYVFDPRIMALDAPHFEALRPQRVELALRLKDLIDSHSGNAIREVRKEYLTAAPHAFDLRVPERLRVHTGGVQPRRARITVGLVCGNASGDVSRRCIDALRQHTPEAELLILESRAEEPLGRAWNRLSRTTESDYLVVMSDRYQVEATWLESLLSGLRHGAALVTPLIWDALGNPTYGGIALEAPTAIGAPRELLTLPGDICLIDMARCRNLLFDERYSRYFACVDFGLRAWERGLPVACAAGARVTRLPGSSQGRAAVQFDRDRALFESLWSNRLLGKRLVTRARELGRFMELGREIPGLFHRRWHESTAAYKARTDRLLDEARRYPVLCEALVDVAADLLAKDEIDVANPQKCPLADLLAKCG